MQRNRLTCYPVAFYIFALGNAAFGAAVEAGTGLLLMQQSLVTYDDRFYGMPVDIGTPPQRLTLTVRIGANFGDSVLVASAACDGCSQAHAFNETASTTFKSSGSDTVSVNGKVVYVAEDASDQITAVSGLNGKTLFTAMYGGLAVVKAEHETSLFTQQPFDGLIDLTMSAGNIVGATKDLPSSVFSVYLKRTCLSARTENAGVITYGGIDTVNCVAPVNYVKVTPDCGGSTYTKRYSYVKVDRTASSTAVVEDAWMARLSAVDPMTLTSSMFNLFNANWKATTSNGQSWRVDCNDMSKSPLVFTINGVDYSVPFEQLVIRNGDTCTLDITVTDDNQVNSIVLGLPFSRQFCMVFDFPQKRIGFASKKVSDGAGCNYAPLGTTTSTHSQPTVSTVSSSSASTSQPPAKDQSQGSAATQVPIFLVIVAYVASALTS